MADTDQVFLYIGTYATEAQAQGDYDLVKELHTVEAIGTYDAAMVTKDEQGRVHVNKDETATRRGAWGGAAAGAVIGILFPPAIIGTAVVAAAAGGISGHLWRGMSRSDVRDLGDLIDSGQAALIVVGQTPLEDVLDSGQLNADRHLAKQLDVSSKDIDKAVHEAAREAGDEWK
jgi:uncharacterized membrane protein